MGNKITLCGSTKFKREFEAINKQLTLEGNIVYSVAFFGHYDKIELTAPQKEILDLVHLKKIANSDVIFVINIEGYIGESTRKEIDYAGSIGKSIKYLSDFPDLITLCDSVTMSLSNLKPEQQPKSAEEIAQWVIDNRYAKSENDKISDFEMFTELTKKIEEI